MSSAESVHPGADMERFVREQMAFVGLREEDVEVIRRTAPFVLKHEAALTAALYEHFLKFPATAKFFLAEDGSPDRVRIERRRHSLGRWLGAQRPWWAGSRAHYAARSPACQSRSPRGGRR